LHARTSAGDHHLKSLHKLLVINADARGGNTLQDNGLATIKKEFVAREEMH